AGNDALSLFESIADMLEHMAARQALVIVLEDLHWADEMSLRLLAFVSRRVAAWPTLLLTTVRDEDLVDASMARRIVGELSDAPDAVALTLAPLSRPDLSRLVRALARVGIEAPAIARIEERIWAMSEGNPFVTLQAMRAREQDSAADRARCDPGDLTLPARVRDLVARRLDRLSPRGQQMAAVAAVIGRQFDFTLLRSASGIDERDAAESIEELVRYHV